MFFRSLLGLMSGFSSAFHPSGDWLWSSETFLCLVCHGQAISLGSLRSLGPLCLLLSAAVSCLPGCRAWHVVGIFSPAPLDSIYCRFLVKWHFLSYVSNKFTFLFHVFFSQGKTPSPRAAHACATVGNRGYVFGGRYRVNPNPVY